MPRHPHVFRRGATWYYRRRIPTDLFEAGVYGDQREFKESLKTTDLRTASTRANARDVVLNHEFAQKRRELVTQPVAGQSSKASRERSLTTLSSLERKELVLRWFVGEEQEAEKARRKYSARSLRAERDVFIENLIDDLTAYGSFDGTNFWEQAFKNWLAEQGIKFETGEAADELGAWLMRARVESANRTLSHLQGKPSSELDGLFKGVGSTSPHLLSDGSASQKTLGELCEEFVQHRKTTGKRPSTLKSYNLPIQVLNDLFSPSRPIAAFTYEDGKRIIEFLARIPVHADKHYPGLSLVEAAAKEAGCPRHGVISANRQGDVFVTIKGIFKHAHEIHWLARNPFWGAALMSTLPAVNESQPVQMTGKELTRLLTSKDFLKERTRKGRTGELHQGRFWSVLLLLLHGLRANEAAQLFVSDVKEENGIAFLDVTETDEEGQTVKHLKTKVSRRRVPLHKEILKIGFMKFVEAQRQRDPKGRLFHEFKPNNLGNYAASLSKWFGRLREKIFGEQKKGDRGLHSMRHGVTDAVRRVSMSDEIRYALCGHSAGEKMNSGFDYGTGYPLKDLKRIVDRIKFDGLDLNFLYA